MTYLLAVERMKLLSTRSPWLCGVLACVVSVLIGVLISGGVGETSDPPTVASTQFGFPFALALVLALGALAVTTEYGTGTIHATFQAVPSRIPILLAKAAVVAGFAFVVGEIAGFGAWGASLVVAPNADLALNSPADWTIVAGGGFVDAFAAVFGVGVGLLVRHSAGAVALVLVYNLTGENLVTLIPHAGDAIHRWLPFNVAAKFLSGTGGAQGGRSGGNANVLSDSPLGQPWALAYFAAVTLAVLAAGVVTARRRDA